MWLANERCRFRQTLSPAPGVDNSSNQSVNNVTQNNNTVTSGNTMETSMKAIMDRLEKLESRMPPTQNLEGFPPMEGGEENTIQAQNWGQKCVLGGPISGTPQPLQPKKNNKIHKKTIKYKIPTKKALKSNRRLTATIATN